MLLTYKENVHSTQMYIPLKPLFSRHKGIGVQFTDEPTGNLDSRSSEAVIHAFLEAQKNLNATTFMVTHDSFSASYCDRVIVMRDGRIYKEFFFLFNDGIQSSGKKRASRWRGQSENGGNDFRNRGGRMPYVCMVCHFYFSPL